MYLTLSAYTHHKGDISWFSDQGQLTRQKNFPTLIIFIGNFQAST